MVFAGCFRACWRGAGLDLGYMIWAYDTIDDDVAEAGQSGGFAVAAVVAVVDDASDADDFADDVDDALGFVYFWRAGSIYLFV